MVIRGEPPSYCRWTILISPPIYQLADTLACSECERTNQFTNLHHQTSQECPDWLLCPPRSSAQERGWNTNTHTHTHARTHGAHSSSSRSRAAGRQGAPHWRPDGADTTRPIVHTCWSVPRRGLTAGHKADVALNHQCISMRGSHRSHLCVCVWEEMWRVGGGL